MAAGTTEPYVFSDHSTGDHAIVEHMADEVYVVTHRRYRLEPTLWIVRASSRLDAARAMLAHVRMSSPPQGDHREHAR